MKAALFDAQVMRVSIQDIPMPQPGPDDLLIRVCRCGICASDVAMTSDVPFTMPSGQFGHEYSGEVAEVGRNITTHKPGDRIAAVPVAPCGVCRNCISGSVFLCSSPRWANTGFSEYAVVPPRAAIRLPNTVSMAEAALIEPMATGLHAMVLAGVGSGARVLVIGAGSQALSAIYWARHLGAGHIAVLSRSARRSDLALAMGAHAVLGFQAEEQARISEVLGGMPDIVVECVGKPGFIGLAVEHVRPGGTVLAMGMCMQPETLLPALCTFKEVRMLFPLGYTLDEFIETARAFDAGNILADAMIGDAIRLEDLPCTMEAMRGGTGMLKIQVDLTLDSCTSNDG